MNRLSNVPAIKLKRDRRSHTQEMRKILSASERDSRALTDAEKARWDQLERGISDIDAELDEREQRAPAEPSSTRVLSHLTPAPASSEWRNVATGEPIHVLGPGDSLAALLTRADSGSEEQQVTLGDFARALVIGPRTEFERRALSEGSATAGGHLVPTPLAAEVIDRLRARTVVLRAGARTIPMDAQTLKIAKVVTDSTAGWLAEAASMSSNDPTFGVVTLTAKTLRCLVIASREVVEDAPNFDEVLRNMLSSAFAVEVDRAALMGSGSGAEPQGLFNQSGVGAVANGANGAVLANYDQWTVCVQTLLEANVQQATAWVMAPRTIGQQARYKATDGQVLVPHPLVSSIPSMHTTSIPVNQTVGTSTDCSTVFAGDFTQMLIGMRSEFSIRVLQERYADTHQVGFVASLRADVQLAQPSAFLRMTGVRA